MDMCILPVLTYGAQTWSLINFQKSAFKVYQRAIDGILDVKLIDKIQNTKCALFIQIQIVSTKQYDNSYDKKIKKKLSYYFHQQSISAALTLTPEVAIDKINISPNLYQYLMPLPLAVHRDHRHLLGHLCGRQLLYVTLLFRFFYYFIKKLTFISNYVCIYIIIYNISMFLKLNKEFGNELLIFYLVLTPNCIIKY